MARKTAIQKTYEVMGRLNVKADETTTFNKFNAIRRDAVTLHVYFQRDPRGMPVYLSLQPIPADNYYFNNNTVAVG